MMDSYIFYTNADREGLVEHEIIAESAGIGYLILLDSGYKHDEIKYVGLSK